MLTTATLIRSEAGRTGAGSLTALAMEARPPGETSAGTLAQGSTAEVISSTAEVQIHEEKVFAHLNEEKECVAGTWVLDTGAMKHMSRC
jgi:hypothetical protein